MLTVGQCMLLDSHSLYIMQLEKEVESLKLAKPLSQSSGQNGGEISKLKREVLYVHSAFMYFNTYTLL